MDLIGVKCLALGQVGYRLEFNGLVFYVDPYLTDSVELVEGAEFKRLYPVIIDPHEICDANYVLITHEHGDHFDLDTLLPIAQSSPDAIFICPFTVYEKLISLGVDASRVWMAPQNGWVKIANGVSILAVPSAHPNIDRNKKGEFRYVGYVFEIFGRRIYHPGDTCLSDELLSILMKLTPIDVAFLPVNERNYFRESSGIIGNMTIREAFELGSRLNLVVLIPTHWDMFVSNSVYLEEMKFLYEMLKPKFSLKIYPKCI
jgi:L-ascorbate metabolism protein UlaG (beta-lactamase superfamily)